VDMRGSDFDVEFWASITFLLLIFVIGFELGMML
jgi:hypothetical protein